MKCAITNRESRSCCAGTQFTCFTGTNVQVLTLHAASQVRNVYNPTEETNGSGLRGVCNFRSRCLRCGDLIGRGCLVSGGLVLREKRFREHLSHRHAHAHRKSSTVSVRDVVDILRFFFLGLLFFCLPTEYAVVVADRERIRRQPTLITCGRIPTLPAPPLTKSRSSKRERDSTDLADRQTHVSVSVAVCPSGVFFFFCMRQALITMSFSFCYLFHGVCRRKKNKRDHARRSVCCRDPTHTHTHTQTHTHTHTHKLMIDPRYTAACWGQRCTLS